MADNVVEYGIEVKDNSAEAFNGFQKNVEAVNRQLEGLSKRLEEISKAQAGAATAAKENAGATAALKKVSTEIERGFTDLFGVLQKIEESTKAASAATKELVDAQERGTKAVKGETAAVDQEAEAMKRYAAEVHRVAEEAKRAKAEKEAATSAAQRAAGGLDKLATANQKVDKAARLFRGTTSLLRGDLVGFTQGLKGVSAELAGKLALGAAVATLAFQQWRAVIQKLCAEVEGFYQLHVAERMRGIASATEEANKRMERRIELIQRETEAQKAALAASAARSKAMDDYDTVRNDREEARELEAAGEDAAKQNEIRRKHALERADIQAHTERKAIETEGKSLDAEQAGLEKLIKERTAQVGQLKTREKRSHADRVTWEQLGYARGREGGFWNDAGDVARWTVGVQADEREAKFNNFLSDKTRRDATVGQYEEALRWNQKHDVNSQNETELSNIVADKLAAEKKATEDRQKAEDEIAEARRKLADIEKQREALGFRAKAADERAAKAREDAQRQFEKAEKDRVKAEEERAKHEDAEKKAEREQADAKVVRDAGIRVANYQKHEGQFGEGGAGARKFVETYFGRTFSKAEWEEFRKAPENQAIVKAAKTDWLRVQSAETETRKRTAEAEETAAKKVAEEFAPKIDEAEQKRLEAREKRKFDHHDVAAELRNEREARKEARAQERKEKRALELRKKAKEWEQAAKPLSEGGHGMRLSPFQQKAVDMMRKRDKEEHDAQQARLDLERKQREAEEAAKKAAEQRQKMTDALENIDANLVKALTVQ